MAVLLEYLISFEAVVCSLDFEVLFLSKELELSEEDEDLSLSVVELCLLLRFLLLLTAFLLSSFVNFDEGLLELLTYSSSELELSNFRSLNCLSFLSLS